jgi:hypothetical protein
MNYRVPYDFVLKELYPLRPKIKKMLGGYMLLLGKKMIFFLREKEEQIEFNGVFVATEPEHFAALQNEIHTSKMVFDFDGTKDSWLFISEDLDDFEQKVKKACEMIKSRDERMGKSIR